LSGNEFRTAESGSTTEILDRQPLLFNWRRFLPGGGFRLSLAAYLTHQTRCTAMNEKLSLSEYLVISRGKWDENASPEKIQNAIDDFYVWLGRMVEEGKMRPGQRLGHAGATVSRQGIMTDGPFGEAKEVIGGYWYILAGSLEEAAQIASGNPCLKCGLFYEIRPTDSEKASASVVTTETPNQRQR
jgi:hypothetical protein